jgi:hypothetical protein
MESGADALNVSQEFLAAAGRALSATELMRADGWRKVEEDEGGRRSDSAFDERYENHLFSTRKRDLLKSSAPPSGLMPLTVKA